MKIETTKLDPTNTECIVLMGSEIKDRVGDLYADNNDTALDNLRKCSREELICLLAKVLSDHKISLAYNSTLLRLVSGQTSTIKILRRKIDG